MSAWYVRPNAGICYIFFFLARARQSIVGLTRDTYDCNMEAWILFFIDFLFIRTSAS